MLHKLYIYILPRWNNRPTDRPTDRPHSFRYILFVRFTTNKGARFKPVSLTGTRSLAYQLVKIGAFPLR